MAYIQLKEKVIRDGVLKLLEIKDSDIRLLTLKQCADSIDKGIHIGGAFSAVIPLVTLFYGGFIKLDVQNPTKRGQDMFILSKGHAVASLASIYAELGYFERSVLENSRSMESILNGHPGPILPGIQISTGPLGQGLSVAEGFAVIGQENPKFNVYCMVGDGELQEGSIWEAVMYSSYKKLDNLCVIIDKNYGQLDNSKQLIFPMLQVADKLKSFGWRVFEADGTKYEPVLNALDMFKNHSGNGRPTAIICDTLKGYGGYSDFMNKHKVNIPDALMQQEVELQIHRRISRIREFIGYFESMDHAYRNKFLEIAEEMKITITANEKEITGISPRVEPVKTIKASKREKEIMYKVEELPRIDQTKQYSASDVIRETIKVFAMDTRIVSIDSDLSSTSGLQPGIMQTDITRALNVGIAESNMMCIGEAYAAMGYNAWVSTFCPFFDWRVMRRIAISYQERMEAIQSENGWLSEGHGLDITFVATAPNFETQTNGATHMGNDDITIFDGIAHLRIIDVSCPQQLLGIMKWIAKGNQGLVYLRVMRSPSGVLYGSDFEFDFGKGYILKENKKDSAVIISSGRGVHEALAAAGELKKIGIGAGVIDMPSINEKILLDVYESNKLILVAEQNNGYLLSHFMKTLFKNKRSIDTERLASVNTLDANGNPQFIHSGTYNQLVKNFGLQSDQLASLIKSKLHYIGR